MRAPRRPAGVALYGVVTMKMNPLLLALLGAAEYRRLAVLQ